MGVTLDNISTSVSDKLTNNTLGKQGIAISSDEFDKVKAQLSEFKATYGGNLSTEALAQSKWLAPELREQAVELVSAIEHNENYATYATGVIRHQHTQGRELNTEGFRLLNSAKAEEADALTKVKSSDPKTHRDGQLALCHAIETYDKALDKFQGAAKLFPTYAKAQWNVACTMSRMLALDGNPNAVNAKGENVTDHFRENHDLYGLQGHLAKAIKADPSYKQKIMSDDDLQVARTWPNVLIMAGTRPSGTDNITTLLTASPNGFWRVDGTDGGDPPFKVEFAPAGMGAVNGQNALYTVQGNSVEVTYMDSKKQEQKLHFTMNADGQLISTSPQMALSASPS